MFDWMQSLFQGKTIQEQMKTLILLGIAIMLAEIVITKFIKWLKKKLK